MSRSKPRLAIVSSHNICCALAYYADALKDFLTPSFDVEIVDLKTSLLLRQEGENYHKMSEAYIDELCARLKEFDVVNVHLELGLYGTKTEQITSRILKICQAAGRLILTVHTIDYKGPHTGHFHVYEQIMNALKRRPSSNPFHLIAHLASERALIEKVYGLTNVSDFPLIFLTNERREHFKKKRTPAWKKQFGFKESDITLGVFGLQSAHKNHIHAFRTLNLLPDNYKLLVIGEAHHMNVKEWQVDPVIQEMVTYLDNHPALADRVFFTGKRDDAKYYEDLANIDFVILPSFEVSQSGSATLSNGLELCCAILKSNTMNSREYQTYFPDCFEVFDIGNYYETKNKILNFDQTKLENLRSRIDSFSEVQLRKMYMDIYDSMKSSVPVELKEPLSGSFTAVISPSLPSKTFVRRVYNRMPRPVQAVLKKLKKWSNFHQTVRDSS